MTEQKHVTYGYIEGYSDALDQLTKLIEEIKDETRESIINALIQHEHIEHLELCLLKDEFIEAMEKEPDPLPSFNSLEDFAKTLLGGAR